MALTATEKTSFINRVRSSSLKICQAWEEMQAELDQWTALDMGGAESEDKLQDSDFIGDNAGLDVADISAVVGTSLTALTTMMGQGHATNYYRAANRRS